MSSKSVSNLLQDESFLNYCFAKNAEDVIYWEKWLAENPDRKNEIAETRNLAILMTNEIARQQADGGFAALLNRIENNRNGLRGVFKLSTFQRFALAASVLLIGALSLLLYHNSLAPSGHFMISKNKDISAGRNRALLILGDGKRIDITDAKNGVLLKEKGVEVSKTADGQIVYRAKVTANAETDQYNTIETPAGGQYQVVLPDGSKVWLNSSSSLKYPTVFNKMARRVELKGEAYFEVAHVLLENGKSKMPFVVKTIRTAHEDQEVEVLGTHFNINGYNNEPAVATTLLEGLVKVSAKTLSPVLLKPGQQATLNQGHFKVSPADIESVVAWKNGDFVFREDLTTAMRKIARWYDVEVVYDSSAPEKLMLGGWISRKNNISEVLNRIQSTGKVHFELTGRRVTVLK